MVFWLRRRSETNERIEAVAHALIRDYGVEAYGEARRMEREANSLPESRNWSRVANAIAGRRDEPVGPDTAIGMATDARIAPSHETVVRCSDLRPSMLSQADQATAIVSESSRRARSRIHSRGLATDPAAPIVAEVAVIRDADPARRLRAKELRPIDAGESRTVGRKKSNRR